MIRNKQYVLFWGEQMRMNPEVEFTDGFKRMMNLVWRVEKG